jgi:putative hydrolase of the HAD superfamily
MGPMMRARPGRPAPLKAVLFDAGNTLLRMNYRVLADYLGRRGHPRDPVEIEEAEIRARVRLDPHLAPGASTESGRTHGRYLRYLLEHLGITDEREIEEIARWRRDYNAPVGLWNQADPEAAAALGWVKAAGLTAGVISNSNGSVRSILEDTGLAAHLDFVIDSALVGVEKPDPRIFRLGLAEAGARAEEAIYIGDLYSVDVLGARAVGMDVVLLDPRGLWGPRECPRAPSLRAAVRLAVG